MRAQTASPTKPYAVVCVAGNRREVEFARHQRLMDAVRQAGQLRQHGVHCRVRRIAEGRP